MKKKTISIVAALALTTSITAHAGGDLVESIEELHIEEIKEIRIEEPHIEVSYLDEDIKSASLGAPELESPKLAAPELGVPELGATEPCLNCPECPELPLAKTQPVKPCPEPKIVYRDRIVEKTIYRDKIVYENIPSVPVYVLEPKEPETNGFYLGVGVTGVDYIDSIHCSSGMKVGYRDVTYGPILRAGYDANRYIGVEVRGSKTYHGTKIKHVGAFIKPIIPLGDNVNVYGLAGYAKTDVRNANIPDINKKGLALGIGVEVDLSKDTSKDAKYSRNFDGQGDQESGLGFFIDYERMNVEKNSKISLDAISAGVTYDF